MKDYTKENKFERLILEVVEAGLTNTLGESAKVVLLHHIEETCNLKKHGIPKRINDFARGLEAVLGPGAEVIEHAIVNDLYNRLGLKTEEIGGFRFVDYIDRAREKKFERKK